MPTLQAVPDESGSGAGASEGAPATRVEQGAFRVELRGGGWSTAIGRVRNECIFERLALSNGLRFVRIQLDAFIFGHAAAVLQMQGMPLQDFFAPDAEFVDTQGSVFSLGPYVFLKGELSQPWEPPLRIKNVVLAAVESVPEELTKEEVHAALLEHCVRM